MIKKGIILAGGSGTRLSPLTKSVNKQLLPIHDKPMIFYPLSVLMLANIRNVLMIVNPGQINTFKGLIGDGSRFGIKIDYKVQDKPRGLPDAFNLGKSFIKNENVALILGDNFFYGQSLTKQLKDCTKIKKGAKIFLHPVKNPSLYGVATINKFNKITKIIEKPKRPNSNLAVTGLYFFDNKVISYSKSLRPSKRKEIEIVDLLNKYKKNKKLTAELLGRGGTWLDTGSITDFNNASNFVGTIENRQGFKIGCIEEIAFRNGWINKFQLKKSMNFYGNCLYSKYLNSIMNGK